MTEQPIPEIEPLISSIENIGIGYFMKTQDFKRFLIKIERAEEWREIYEIVSNKETSIILSADWDSEYYRVLNALTYWFNHFYERSKDTFYFLFTNIIINFENWETKEIKYYKIIEDLKLINAPQEVIVIIEKLNRVSSVPAIEIPNNIWNAEKLEDFINKMDISIRNKEYNQTLTYAYSCLEGLFKSFIRENIPEEKSIDDLTKSSKIVKSYIIEHFKKNNIDYPEQIINLISTITSSVANARNQYSASHFNNNAEKWLAEFARDCVNSIGRLILKFS